MKLLLIGYMGSGKSTIGAKLASKLSLSFIDLDRYIEKREGQSIPDIFRLKGEIYFRKIESKYLQELLASDDSFVLALGGGTPCYAGNMDRILESEATSIYLRGSISTLAERLSKNKSRRPLIAQLEDAQLPEYIGKHLFERRNDYERSSIKISIDQKNIEEVVSDLWMHLQ